MIQRAGSWTVNQTKNSHSEESKVDGLQAKRNTWSLVGAEFLNPEGWKV
jgi:hypothetical protein